MLDVELGVIDVFLEYMGNLFEYFDKDVIVMSFEDVYVVLKEVLFEGFIVFDYVEVFD